MQRQLRRFDYGSAANEKLGFKWAYVMICNVQTCQRSSLFQTHVRIMPDRSCNISRISRKACSTTSPSLIPVHVYVCTVYLFKSQVSKNIQALLRVIFVIKDIWCLLHPLHAQERHGLHRQWLSMLRQPVLQLFLKRSTLIWNAARASACQTCQIYVRMIAAVSQNYAR